MQNIAIIITLFICTNLLATTIPDYAKESRWATQVEDGLMDGEIVKISGADKNFIAIFTESEEESKKAAIIMHGIGIHPDWSEVINPLRVALTSQNYNTLSIQLPVLANDATSADYTGLLPISDKRIQASIKYLQQQGFTVDLLLAHSLGTTMASHFLANNPHSFKRYIAIGSNQNSVKYLQNIDMNVLDIYGTDDLKMVITSVKNRKQAVKNPQKYTQKQIKGNHFFSKEIQSLITVINNWLKIAKIP